MPRPRAPRATPPTPARGPVVRRGLRRLFEDRLVPERRLRAAVDELPLRARQAMLDGVLGERIIAGAYTDGQRGVCPMLAAHRRGARVAFLPFAKAWDAYADAPSRGPRDAPPAAVADLAAMLRHSIETDPHAPPRPVPTAERAVTTRPASDQSQPASARTAPAPPSSPPPPHPDHAEDEAAPAPELLCI